MLISGLLKYKNQIWEFSFEIHWYKGNLDFSFLFFFDAEVKYQKGLKKRPK